MTMQEIKKLLDAEVAERATQALQNRRLEIGETIRNELLRGFDQQLEARLAELRPAYEEEARRRIVQEITDGALGALAVPPEPMSPKVAQQVFDKLTPGEVRGFVKMKRGGWKCLHCQRQWDTQRAVALHEPRCEKRPGQRPPPVVEGKSRNGKHA